MRFMIPSKVASISEDGFTLAFTSECAEGSRISTENLPFPYFPPLSVGDEVGIYFAMGGTAFYSSTEEAVAAEQKASLQAQVLALHARVSELEAKAKGDATEVE